ncbi:hypothetical protein [Microbacterium pygmaeum]|uniref:Uncharacterized protein n=1 Tax=Microbacterium pygmaeum TaxID=370764 RepID=A0A1G7YGK2_9MICO|nr:hypothetical protein [Microbacterium pygmaeum]SDG95476.1 hypothetical protein SAMN04489810_1745 [Microbacterium pygmaeum]
MTRADKYPDQATAAMDRLQEEARQTDDARDEATFREERLVGEIDAAYEAGDHAKVEGLQALHQQAEVDIVNTTSDFEAVMDQIGDAQRFWYEEDDDDDDDDNDDD